MGVEEEEPMDVDAKKDEEVDSFYAMLMKSDRKKSNGSDDIAEEEFTPEEMKQRVKNWVGKKINLKHNRKDGFGMITAAWHTKDGQTHVRLSPGNSQIGKDVAQKLKNREITAVSPGWLAHKDRDTKKVVGKDEDHVALTNYPVYEGTLIYAVGASQDGLGIQEDEHGVLRTKGGLAVLPVDDIPAAVMVEKEADCSPSDGAARKGSPKNSVASSSIWRHMLLPRGMQGKTRTKKKKIREPKKKKERVAKIDFFR